MKRFWERKILTLQAFIQNPKLIVIQECEALNKVVPPSLSPILANRILTYEILTASSLAWIQYPPI